MSVYFTPQELAHYARQINLLEIGEAGQYKLKQSRVLCVGAGGLGSAAMMYLTAAGIGTIGIIDDDHVDVSNLHRQLLYSYTDIGCKKVVVAQTKLRQLNPDTNLIIYDTQLNRTNALTIINEYDVIIDGSDNFATRFVVNDACFQLSKPHVYASISRFLGQCSVFTMKNGPCFRCLFDKKPPADFIPNCAESGVLGVLPGIMGSIQATEAIKIILGVGQLLVGRLLLFNALNMQFNEFSFKPDPACRLCQYQEAFSSLSHDETPSCVASSYEITVSELQTLQQQGEFFLLVDVREPFEYEICRLQGKLIPLNDLPTRLSELDRNQCIILYCKYGERSKQAVHLLTEHHFTHVRSLKGGIMAWIEQIEPCMQRY